MLVRAAQRYGFTVDYYTSLMDMWSVGRFEQYNAAIIDYDLGSMSGIEVAESLPILFNEMPIVLVSGRDRLDSAEPDSWPQAIRCFMNKDSGMDAIVNTAAGLLLRRSPASLNLMFQKNFGVA